MKALCIIGSPRNEGSTAFLVDRVIQGLKDEGVDVERRILSDLNINYCRGCRECEQTGQCCQDDDMGLLIKGIMESDLVLLASPAYWGEITGQMKVFFDRSLPLCNARTGKTPVPEGKIGISVAVRAGKSKAENLHIIDTFRHYFGHLGIKSVAAITAEDINELSDIMNNESKIAEAGQLGRYVAGALKQLCADE